ncbi:hypothetical protein B0H19DRAFT_543987 [Mycena capillaripes]|nr:hypothetical protein B0H19DRAFT_543987 [Mycena capillaripes]
MSITKNYSSTPAIPSDFRMLPLADIDLQHEIHLDIGTGIVDRRRGVRRIYSARVGGQNTTVAMYQGYGAEEEWRQDIAKYMSLRHPNIIQMSGAASSGGIHVTLFHDDLVPFQRFLDLHQNSHFSTIYIYALCICVPSVTWNMVYPDSSKVHGVSYSLRIFLVRLSALGEGGRFHTMDTSLDWPSLCRSLYRSDTAEEPPLMFLHDLTAKLSHMQGISPSSATNTTMVIDTLTTEEYQDICFYDLALLTKRCRMRVRSNISPELILRD